MDTRKKIFDLDEATEMGHSLRCGGIRFKIVVAYCDVLTCDLVRRFKELAVRGQGLVVVVVDPPHPLLPARARAELAAALAVIDYVVLLDGADLTQALELIKPYEVIREEVADSQRSQALIEHVHRRQRA